MASPRRQQLTAAWLPETAAGLPLRGAARIQRLLQEHRHAAMLARQFTGIAVDPDMVVSMNDLGRRRVAAHDVSAACEQLGLGRMTQARLARPGACRT
ncbi:MAG: hypothetical protein PVH54_11080 [Gammaproteobacteria bacterium]